MKLLRYSRSAERDFENIFEYVTVQSGSAVTAQNHIRQLRRRCKHLASLPGKMGRPRPELGAEIRSRAFGNYVIYLRYTGSELRIVRVIEAHRDVDLDDVADDS